MTENYDRRFAERKRLEQDGLFVQNPEHWETWQNKIYIYTRCATYKTKKGEVRKTRATFKTGMIRVPLDIVRHLKLKHKDKIMIAIKRVSE